MEKLYADYDVQQLVYFAVAESEIRVRLQHPDQPDGRARITCSSSRFITGTSEAEGEGVMRDSHSRSRAMTYRRVSHCTERAPVRVRNSRDRASRSQNRRRTSGHEVFVQDGLLCVKAPRPRR